MNKMILYKILRPLVYVLFKIVYKPKVINKENIPERGRCILAGTHTNNLDFITVGMGTKRPVRYVAKDELMKGINKYFFKAVGIIPVNRRIHDKSVIPTCVDLLNKEELVGIFPEGTINRTNDLIMPFKKGAVVMSIRAKSKIVPFAINGMYKRGKLKIIFGEAYYPKTEDIEKETKVLEDKVIDLIKKASDNK